MWMRTLLLAVALATTPGLWAAASEDEAAIREVVRRYVEARGERNPRAIEALFTEDADQLVSSGEWRHGRPELVKGMLASSAGRPGDRTITVDRVRFLTDDVALADGPYVIAATGAQAERRMFASFVMKKMSGQWRIAAIRNMLPAK